MIFHINIFFLLKAEGGIFDTIFGILIILVIIFGFSLLLSWMSKVSGRSLSYRGEIHTTPQDFDRIKEKLKKDINSVKKIPIDFSERIKKIKELIEKKKIDKVEKLEKLNELKKANVISDEELEQLKKEILK